MVQTGGQIDEWTNKGVCKPVYVWVYRQRDSGRPLYGWVDGQMCRLLNGWVDRSQNAGKKITFVSYGPK